MTNLERFLLDVDVDVVEDVDVVDPYKNDWLTSSEDCRRPNEKNLSECLPCSVSLMPLNSPHRLTLSKVTKFLKRQDLLSNLTLTKSAIQLQYTNCFQTLRFF